MFLPNLLLNFTSIEKKIYTGGLNSASIKILQLNFGPQHPAAHGVLGLIIYLNGEYIVKGEPHIGLLHRGTEKLIEYKPYIQNLPYFDGLDYVSMMVQEHIYCLSIEILLKCSIFKRASYIGVFYSELTRLLNHLLAVTTHALDVGAITPFFWIFEEREKIFEFYERVAGGGMHANYFGPGGILLDLPIGLCNDIKCFLNKFAERLDELEDLLTENGIWKIRLINVGVVKSEICTLNGFSGPMLRASGYPWDIGYIEPYEIYSDVAFNIPYGINGDCYDRYLIGIQEMGQSIKIIDYCISKIKFTSIKIDDQKIITLSRIKIKKDMESLIHHFKLYTEGYNLPMDEIYCSVEAPKGEFGVILKSNNTGIPTRCHIKSPGLLHLAGLKSMLKNSLLADLITIIGTQDIVFGEIDR